MPVPQSVLDLVSRFESQRAAIPQEQERLARDIATTDLAIDTLVYQLYDLTPAEIAIAEGT